MNILSRWRPRYLRSLVYMLQSSEYDLHAYLAWYHRTSDFSCVERRGHLRKTPKALALLLAGWSMIVLGVFIIVAGVLSEGDIPRLVALGLALALPFLLPYVLAGFAVAFSVLQRPVEAHLLRKASARLQRHKGVKIAIAGSFGKTTMREILRAVLSEGKKVAAPGGSHNTPIAISRFVSSLEGDEDVLVFELGEYYPGDVRKLCEVVRPDIGVITGVNEAHLEKFKTLARAADTVFELADFLGGKPCYVNGENEEARRRARKSHVVYSRQRAGSWRAEGARSDLSGTSFELVCEERKEKVASKLLGLHQIGPLLAGASIAKRLGLPMEEIARGIGKTRPFEHRLEPRKESGAVTLDDSYNGNPDGAKAVIEFLASLEGHRRWYVTPGLVEMGPRAEAVHREIGKWLAESGIEKVILIRNSVTPWIEAGLKEASFKGEVVWFDDALTCYRSLPRLTAAGDVVLLQNDWPDRYA